MGESNSYYFFLLVSLVVLLCFSTFFSACEMAFSSLNRIKLKTLAAKSKRARLALKMLDVYDKLLSTVLIGNNFVNIASSSLATALFMSLFGEKGVGMATAIMTVILIVFGDISPKTLAKETPELFALRTAPVLRIFLFLFTPFNFLLTAWKKLLMIIFPVKEDRSTTEDELLTFVGEVRQEGGININEEQMIRQVIGFDDLKVSGIFTPRIDVAAVPVTAATEEIDSKFTETGFSRLPVFQETIDDIKGIIIFKDFYQEVMKGLKKPEEIIKPVVYVNKTIKIGKLLKTLQEKQSHLAVVIDEHGGTLGIVTIEDIVEELIGEIWDEHDEVVETVKRIADGSYRVLGTVNFQDMLKTITEENSIEDARAEEDIPDTTVANWIMETLGRLPRAGEKLEWRFLKIRVSRVLRQRVMEVWVSVDLTKVVKKEGEEL
jgi:CBS domain containing-hemolysin-like protein